MKIVTPICINWSLKITVIYNLCDKWWHYHQNSRISISIFSLNIIETIIEEISSVFAESL